MRPRMHVHGASYLILFVPDTSKNILTILEISLKKEHFSQQLKEEFWSEIIPWIFQMFYDIVITPKWITFNSTAPTYNSCTKCVGSTCMIHNRTFDCIKFSGHGCDHRSLTDLTTEHHFNSQATWVIDVPGLFFAMLWCYPWVSVKPGTGRRPVHLCRN